MGEHYCTNCGADLESQDGFDPEAGYWICRECGQLLTDPGVHSVSDRFEGVSWFCDRCGAFLNKQTGFSDFYSSWTCTECGCFNRISEDEIEDSEKEDNTDNSSVFRRINSALDNLNKGIEAIAFITGVGLESDDESESENEEEEYDEDEEDDDDIEYEEDAEEENNEFLSESIERDELSNGYHHSDIRERNDKNAPRVLNADYLKFGDDSSEHDLKEAVNKRQLEEFQEEELKRIQRKQIWRAITGKKQIPGMSSDEFKGLPYQDVVNALRKQEFSNINVSAEEDLEIEEKYKENTVKVISIDGETEFNGETKFPYGARIEVIYHQMKCARIPLGPKQVRKLECEDVYWEYKNAGFKNIITAAIDDLKIGFFTKDGSVECVRVDGRLEYKRKEKFRIDVPIIITYHTFPDGNE